MNESSEPDQAPEIPPTVTNDPATGEPWGVNDPRFQLAILEEFLRSAPNLPPQQGVLALAADRLLRNAAQLQAVLESIWAEDAEPTERFKKAREPMDVQLKLDRQLDRFIRLQSDLANQELRQRNPVQTGPRAKKSNFDTHTPSDPTTADPLWDETRPWPR